MAVVNGGLTDNISISINAPEKTVSPEKVLPPEPALTNEPVLNSQEESNEAIKMVLLQGISAELKNGNYGLAITKMEELETLQLKIPASIKYLKGISYLKIEDKENARLALKTYLLISSENSRYYSNALALLEGIDSNQLVPISQYANTANSTLSKPTIRNTSQNTLNNPPQTASTYRRNTILEETPIAASTPGNNSSVSTDSLSQNISTSESLRRTFSTPVEQKETENKQIPGIGKVSLVNSDFGYGHVTFDRPVNCNSDRFYILNSGNKQTLSVGKQINTKECTVFPKGADGIDFGVIVYQHTDSVELARIKAEETQPRTITRTPRTKPKIQPKAIAKAPQVKQPTSSSYQASSANQARETSDTLKVTAGILGFASSFVGGDAIIDTVANTLNTTAGAIDTVSSTQQPASSQSDAAALLNGLDASQNMLNAVQSGDLGAFINSEINLFKAFSN